MTLPRPTTSRPALATARSTSMSPSRLPLGEWTLRTRLISLAAGLAIIFLGVVVISMLVPYGWSGGPRVMAEKTLTLLMVMVALALASRPVSRRALGLVGADWRRIVLWAVAGAVLLNAASLAWDKVKHSPPMGEQLTGLGFGTSVTGDLLLILAITMVAPVAEELLFRGLVHRSVRDAARHWLPAPVAIALATVVSTGLFVSIHGDPTQQGMAWVYVLFGLITALTYEFTGSLLTAIVVHCSTNAFAIVEGALDGTGKGLAASWLVVVAVLAPVLGVLLALAVGRVLDAVGGSRRPH